MATCPLVARTLEDRQRPRAASRAEYERALCNLPSAWPELRRRYEMLPAEKRRRKGCRTLRPEACAVVALLLGGIPGGVIRQGRRRELADPDDTPGLAELLGCDRTKAWRCLEQLGALGLVLGVLHREGERAYVGQSTPFGTNVGAYFVNTRLIVEAAAAHREAEQQRRRRQALRRAGKLGAAALLSDAGEPSDGVQGEPSPGSRRDLDRTTPTPSRARRRRQSSRAPTEHRVAAASPPGESSRDGGTPQSAGANPGGSAGERLERDGEQTSGRAARALARRWDELRVRNRSGAVSQTRPCEVAALRNRIEEHGIEAVELALEGAAADSWLRSGGADTAFAYVFGRGEHCVPRYAEKGRAARAEAEVRAETKRRVEAREKFRRRHDALWSRSPWTPNSAPREFREAMLRGDLDAAEAMLPAKDDSAGLTAGSVASTALTLRGTSPELAGVRHIAPGVARIYAEALESNALRLRRHADEADAEGPVPRIVAGESPSPEHAPLLEAADEPPPAARRRRDLRSWEAKQREVERQLEELAHRPDLWDSEDER